MLGAPQRVCASVHGSCVPSSLHLRAQQCATASSWHPRCLRAPHARHITLVRSAAADSSTSSTSDEPEPPSQHELVQWVLQQGGSVNGVELQNVDFGGFERGWGLRITAEAAPGTRLIQLPRSCHLTYDGSTDKKLLRLIEKVPEELWGAKLALQVLAHRVRGPASPFAAYINYLPQAHPGIPTFFTREGVDALQYPPVSEQVKKRGRWLYQFSKEALEPLPGTDADPFNGASVDINALGWALASVSSRAFRTRGPQAPAALLPLVDMANHDFDPNCEVLPAGDGAMALVTKRRVAPGEAVSISYGRLSNDFLLLDYGFLVPGNPYDDVKLRYSAGLLEAGASVAFAGAAQPPQLSMAPWKQAILEGLGLSGAGANLEVGLGGRPPVDARLLAATRVMVAGEKRQLLGRKGGELGAWDKPLAKAVEVPALRLLMGVVAVTLSQFPTQLEEDLALLQPSTGRRPLAADVETAVRFRAVKKQALKAALQQLGEQLAAVQQQPDPSPPDGKRASSKRGSKTGSKAAAGFG